VVVDDDAKRIRVPAQCLQDRLQVFRIIHAPNITSRIDNEPATADGGRWYGFYETG
jgi:hypothetical protein